MSESSIEVTDPSAFRQASLGKQVLFAIVTFALYDIYWFYKTSEQLSNGTNADIDPVVSTLLLFVPLYGMWRFTGNAEAVTDQDHMTLFLLFLFTFGIGGWYTVQSGINEIAAS